MFVTQSRRPFLLFFFFLPEIHVLQLQSMQKNGSKSMLAFNTEADTSCCAGMQQME